MIAVVEKQGLVLLIFVMFIIVEMQLDILVGHMVEMTRSGVTSADVTKNTGFINKK